MRQIDKGLRNSRIGLVLVTPALLLSLQREGVADKELAALLARELLVPIAHGTTFEAIREESPLLGSRSGLSTAEETMAMVATKITELVTVSTDDRKAALVELRGHYHYITGNGSANKSTIEMLLLWNIAWSKFSRDIHGNSSKSLALLMRSVTIASFAKPATFKRIHFR